MHAVKGNVVHRALELLFGHEPDGRTTDAAHGSMGRAKDEYLELPDFRLLNLTKTEAETFWRDCSVLIDGYLKMEDPKTIQNIELELYVEAILGPFTVRGYVDRIEHDTDGHVVISDYKTGRTPRESDVGTKMQQLQLYAYMLREMRGELPAKIQLLYVRSGVKFEAIPSDQSMRYITMRTTAAYDAIERACTTGEFKPRKSGLCNFCAYKPWCPEFGGDPARAAQEVPLMYPGIKSR